MKRLTLCLIGVLTAMTASADSWENHREALDYSHQGTMQDPIVISTPGQLAELAYRVNTDNYGKGLVFVLDNDIDLNVLDDGEQREWTPIGTYDSPFRGRFLGINPHQEGGQPHTVRGLNCTSYDLEYLGLFGVSKGLIAYLNVADAYIYSFQTNAKCGIVCGENTSGSIIYAVHADGALTTAYYSSVGGIVGSNIGHVAHSTAKVTIKNRAARSTVGGIAATTENGVIFDCAADADLSSTQKVKAMGGITGILHSGTVEACAANGALHDQVLHAGGIVGLMEKNSYVRGNVCNATVDTWGGSMAGIVGTMTPGDSYKTGEPTESKIEFCVFAGLLVGATSPVGGICGSLEWDNKEERIVNTLVTGTRILRDNYKTILGKSKAEPVQALSNSYWDKCLYAGTAVTEYAEGDFMTPVTTQGITTDKLTTGKKADARLLESDEEAPFHFKFQAGYYPRLVVNKEWEGYVALKERFASTSLEQSIADAQKSMVMTPSAWLAATPVTIPKGDAAYDLVTSVTHKEKTVSWSENQQLISMKTGLDFPDNCNAISIGESGGSPIATAIANGSFYATMTFKPIAKRPILTPSRRIYFNTTPNQVWDGTIATDYAGGTGVAEDPFIIKTGAQLALAVLTNDEGQWFQQLCNINLNLNFLNDYLIASENARKWVKAAGWKGIYNGGGHFVNGLYTSERESSLFGNISSNAQVHSLGVADAFFSGSLSAVLANNVDGKVYDCIVQGAARPSATHASAYDGRYDVNGSGGLCTSVGANNAGAVVEDCISAVFSAHIFSDFNPLVCLTDKNKGVVRNCLSIAPVLYGDLHFNTNGITAQGKPYISECYWLKGMEPNATGQTLDELHTALGSRPRWQADNNYLPMLKSFAETKQAKLLMLPVRTDLDFDESDSGNFLLGFNRHLLFEPGTASWALSGYSDSFIDADSDMGIITPVRESFSPASYSEGRTRNMIGICYMKATLDNFTYRIPLRTSSSSISPGITFVDENAEQACLEAFNTDRDTQHLSLAELKAVTTEQTLTAFQTATARRIRRFPEFRLFKSVTKLTTQLHGLTQLEEVRLPFALKTIGSNAFSGCTSLKEITVSSNVTDVEPHPFYGSAVSNISVDPFNTEYCSREGMLFTVNNALVAYPNGRQDDAQEITVSGDVTSVEEGALYKLPKLKKLFFDLDDYNRTIPELVEGGIETTDGSLIDVYVKDASFDQEVYSEMLEDYSWEEYAQAGRLHRYYPLKIDRNGLGSFYIGFDAELPESVSPFIVARSRPDLNLAFLQPVSRQVPAESPVVVFAAREGVHILLPSPTPLTPWKMYENRLNGAGVDGVPVYQEDSSEGGVYTLGRADDGTIGFFIHREEKVDPFHAYLPYNSIGDQLDQGVHFKLAYGVSEPNQLTYWACPDGSAILAGYQGEGGGHITVPETIGPFSGQVSGFLPFTSYSVNQIDQGFLHNNKADIWSIDFTKNSLIKGIKADRNDQKNPFYGTDKRTIIYLPDGQGFTAADGEQNVVIGTNCQTLALTDGWGFEPPYDFTTRKGTIDRVLSATHNADGSWTRKAYSVCMPYPIVFNIDSVFKRGLGIYELWDISEETGSFVFTNSAPNYLSAGHGYVVVVQNGTVTLNADAEDFEWNDGFIDVKASPSEEWDVWVDDSNNDDHLMNPKSLGKWTGTFMPMSNAECTDQQAYIIQGDGYFRRVSNTTPAHRKVNLYPFRAFFRPEQSISRNGYKMLFEYHEEGDEVQPNLTVFPSVNYESDGDMPPYDDEMAVGILPIVTDAHHALDGPGHYYDLQGRRLEGKPAKGLYIYKGRKTNK